MGSNQDQAERDAEGIRSRTWGDSIPVDPVRIAKALGVETFESQLDPNVSAVLSKRADRDPIIILNRNDSPSRQRFSCAHELGHFVRRSNSGRVGTDFEYIEYRGPLARQGKDDEEMYANAFAGNLLMPRKYVLAFQKDDLSVVDQALKFEVSTDALETRLRVLGL
jgi:Zn-dependent peptidase ImmA (M78 family)